MRSALKRLMTFKRRIERGHAAVFHGPLVGMPGRGAAIIFALMALVIISLHPMPSTAGSLSAKGDVLNQAAYLLIFFVSVVELGALKSPRLIILPIGLLVLLGWCWASVIWAVEPSVALRRLTLTTVIIFTVFLAVKRAGFDGGVNALRHILTIALLLNYIAVFATPSGIDRGADVLEPNLIGSWRGIFLEKNIAGAVCAITILLNVLSGNDARPSLRWSTVGAALYFLIRTESKTSIGMLLFSLLAGLAYRALGNRYRKWLVPVIGCALVAGGLYMRNNIDLYDPRVFTGRSQIWLVLLAYARDHWLFGSGFGSFWNAGEASPAFQYGHGWLKTIAVGHNGYLDLLTQIGVPGLFLAMVALILLPAWNLLANTHISGRQGGFLFAGLVFCAGHNMTESTMLNRDEIVGVFLIFIVALIYYLALEHPRTGVFNALKTAYVPATATAASHRSSPGI